MYQNILNRRNEYPTLGDLVTSGYQIFDDSWDTYIPEYKEALISKIIRHYFFYEIGTDTPDKFKWYINQQLAEIMPYYNQLYQSTLIKFDPMVNYALKTNSRSIENLLKQVNTQNNAVTQAVKNFIENGAQKSVAGEQDFTVGDSVVDKTGKMVYNKHGAENAVGTVDATEKEHIDTDKDTDSDITNTTNETVTSQEHTQLGGSDRTVGDTDKTSQETTTPNVTEATTGSKNVTSDGTEGITGETSDKTVTTGTTGEKTHLTEHTEENQRKDFSDTPQKSLQLNSVRSDYLTNVTWTDTDTDHTADGTKDTEYEETKDQNGTSKTDKTTNDKSDTTYSDTKVTSGDTVKDGTEHSDTTSTTTYGKTTDTNGTKTTNGTETEKGHVDETGQSDRDLTSHKDTKDDKTWSEHGGEDTQSKEQGHDTRNRTIDSSSDIQSSSERRDNTNSATSGLENKDEKQTTDTGRTDIAEGYMNISGSALLEAFRKTFINVDEQIISQLRDNFMTVY